MNVSTWGRRIAAGLMLSLSAGAAQAEIVDFSVGDNSFRLALYGPLSRVFDNAKGQYDVGVIMRPERNDDLLVVHTGVLLTGDAGIKSANVAAGLGIRGVYIGRDADSGGAVALGGQLEFRFPGYERVGFSVYGYGAPEATSLGQVDKYYEVGVGVDYQVLKDASIYVGYREVRVDIADLTDVKADDSFHIGLRLNF
ncbi:MAG TPA: YfaZ family outer membrane protein [Solimonas sp.]